MMFCVHFHRTLADFFDFVVGIGCEEIAEASVQSYMSFVLLCAASSQPGSGPSPPSDRSA
eukprot:scaffold1348_cov352-Pavlova_lutheri.AAC.1